MTRQLEAKREQKQARIDKETLIAVEYGLVEAVERSGAVLQGFSVKLNGADCLVILKASLAGRTQIAFVGASDLGSAIRKAVKAGNTDQLTWRADKYEKV